MIKAALLDAEGNYLGMVELAHQGLITERHLPQITACDLAPGEYRWVPDAGNPFGGAFWPLKYLAVRAALDEQLAAANEGTTALERHAATRAARRGDI